MNGKVYLIGAGPGDPELMTLKAARALGRADVVLVDELVNRGCLAHARSDAQVIEVGKRGGCKSTPQAFIEKLLVLYARQGKIVARLKGGDPFVFGRGGEELRGAARRRHRGRGHPRHHGRHRRAGRARHSGHAPRARARRHLRHRRTRDGGEPDWEALARSGTTLVIYMGLRNLDRSAFRCGRAWIRRRRPASSRTAR